MNREATTGLDQHAPLFAAPRGDIEVSFEFFPPKSDKMAETLWQSIETLAPLRPRFVSVTYGAGGSTRERTHATVERLVRETDLAPAAPLTCSREPRRDRRHARASWRPGCGISRAARRSARAGPAVRAEARLCQCRRTGRGAKRSRRSNLGRAIPKRIPTAIVPQRPRQSHCKTTPGADRAISQFFSRRQFLPFRDRVAARGGRYRDRAGDLRFERRPTRSSPDGGAAIPAGWNHIRRARRFARRAPIGRPTIAGELCATVCRRRAPLHSTP